MRIPRVISKSVARDSPVRQVLTLKLLDLTNELRGRR